MFGPSRRRRWMFVAGALALASCGGGAEQPITFDTGQAPTLPSTTSSPNISVPLTTSPGPTTSPPGPSATTPSGGSAQTPTASGGVVVASGSDWSDATGALAGLSSECGTISFVAGSPNADLVIAGIGQQGLWAADANDDWRVLGTGSGSAVVDNRPFSIFFDPQDAQQYWEAGGYHGGGVFHTADGGSTFQQLGDLSHLQAVAVDLSDPRRSTLVASGHEQKNLYRSDDGGQTWTDITDTLPAIGYATGVVVSGPQTFLIGTTGAGGQASSDGVYRTTDGGSTWTNVFDAPVAGAPLVSAIDGSIFWVLGQAKGLIRSTDSGETWERVSSSAVLHPNVPTLAELPDGTLVGVGRSSLVQSLDRGATWQTVGPNLPFTDPASITYAAQRNAVYVARNDCDVSATRQPIADGSVQRLDLEPFA